MSAPESAPEIHAEIERTREDLGRTVEELAAKADVKARAKDKVAGMKATAQGKAVQLRDKAAEMPGQLQRSEIVQRRWPLALAAAGGLVIGSVLIWRWRKA
jgi:Protein of unknown function (DUF3618)